jgi:hypothetical protein
MPACPTCNTELTNDHPALVLEALLTWIDTNGGWDLFDSEDYSVGDDLRMPDTNENKVTVEIVALKTTYDSGDVDVDAYYGESALPQGSEFDTYVVFKIGELFFKKTGTGDSYGRVSWDGDLRQVEATTKTVWEFK